MKYKKDDIVYVSFNGLLYNAIITEDGRMEEVAGRQPKFYYCVSFTTKEGEVVEMEFEDRKIVPHPLYVDAAHKQIQEGIRDVKKTLAYIEMSRNGLNEMLSQAKIQDTKEAETTLQNARSINESISFMKEHVIPCKMGKIFEVIMKVRRYRSLTPLVVVKEVLDDEADFKKLQKEVETNQAVKLQPEFLAEAYPEKESVRISA